MWLNGIKIPTDHLNFKEMEKRFKEIKRQN